MLRQMDEPVFSNNAVARCIEAYEHRCEQRVKEMVALFVKVNNREPGPTEIASLGDGVLRQAGDAFREALPPLSGEANIRDFIACVAHGAAIDAIEPSTASKLLYAAQVAYQAAKRYQPRPEF